MREWAVQKDLRPASHLLISIMMGTRISICVVRDGDLDMFLINTPMDFSLRSKIYKLEDIYKDLLEEQ